jgi:hypothetical protein
MAQLTSQSVQQLLAVLALTRRFTLQGESETHAYRDAVRRVAADYSVEYPTIGDFRRRLGYSDVREFRAEIASWLEGSGRSLERRILQHSADSTHPDIRSFFRAAEPGLETSTSAPQPQPARTGSTRSQVQVASEAAALRLQIPADLFRRLQIAHVAGVGPTVEETAINLLQAGFDAQRDRIRSSLSDI